MIEDPDNTDEAEVSAEPKPVRVLVQITKFGEGKVSTGVHIADKGDVMAAKGDVLEVDEATAKSLETQGYAEAQ